MGCWAVRPSVPDSSSSLSVPAHDSNSASRQAGPFIIPRPITHQAGRSVGRPIHFPDTHQAIRCSKYAVTITETNPRHCRPVFSDTASAAQKQEFIALKPRGGLARQAAAVQHHQYGEPSRSAVPVDHRVVPPFGDAMSVSQTSEMQTRQSATLRLWEAVQVEVTDWSAGLHQGRRQVHGEKSTRFECAASAPAYLCMCVCQA